jgi:hypothetical protein
MTLTIIETDKTYISEISELQNTLPHGILNKQITGCGGSTVALENKEDWVIAMPTRNLLVNKRYKYDVDKYTKLDNPIAKLYCYYGGFQNQTDLDTYIEQCRADGRGVKILTTYDQLTRVTKELGDVTGFKLLVDEFHLLFDFANFKGNVCQDVLDTFPKYPHATFMSATPNADKWLPKELLSLPTTKLIFNRRVRLDATLLHSKTPLTALTIMMEEHKRGSLVVDGHKVEQLFIFLNNVSSILDVCDVTSLAPEDVRIVVADRVYNKKRLNELGYELSYPTDDWAKFNLFSSTGFQGIDIESKNGLCVVVSDGSSSTTLNVDTTVLQVSGRIRTPDNIFAHKLIHIFKELPISDDVVSRIKYALQKKVEDSYNFPKEWAASNLSADDRLRRFRMLPINSHYLIARGEINPTFEYSDLLEKKELADLETLIDVYKNGTSLAASYNSAECGAIVYEFDTIIQPSSLSSRVKKRGVNFEYILKEYLAFDIALLAKPCKDRTDEENKLVDDYYAIGREFPLFVKAVQKANNSPSTLATLLNKLGYTKKALECYVQEDEEVLVDSIKRMIPKFFTKGKAYEAKVVKDKLAKIYSKFITNRKAKATDLEEWVSKLEVKKNSGMVYTVLEFAPVEVRKVKESKVKDTSIEEVQDLLA